jgi:hypothetical protein
MSSWNIERDEQAFLHFIENLNKYKSILAESRQPVLKKTDPLTACWEHIRSRWTPKALENAKTQWTDLIRQTNEASPEQLAVCRGCKCLGLSSYVSKTGVCFRCDRSSQPSLANPLNKDLVAKYIPHMYNFYFSPEKLHDRIDYNL